MVETTNKISVVVADLERFIDDTIKKIALDVVANLVRAPSDGGTPIDTSWASANWIPYIGDPQRSTSGARPAQGGRASNSDQQAALATIAASYKHEKGKIVIANNVPYIVRLNEGSSRQAPSGFVQRAIADAVAGAVS